MLCHSLRPMASLTNTVVSQSHPLRGCSVTVSLFNSYFGITVSPAYIMLCHSLMHRANAYVMVHHSDRHQPVNELIVALSLLPLREWVRVRAAAGAAAAAPPPSPMSWSQHTTTTIPTMMHGDGDQ